MVIEKRMYSASDAQPVVLFAPNTTDSEKTYPVMTDSNGRLILSSLVPYAYDAIVLGYDGSNLTSVVYKTGGAAGTTVATLTLGYTGSTLSIIERS